MIFHRLIFFTICSFTISVISCWSESYVRPTTSFCGSVCLGYWLGRSTTSDMTTHKHTHTLPILKNKQIHRYAHTHTHTHTQTLTQMHPSPSDAMLWLYMLILRYTPLRKFINRRLRCPSECLRPMLEVTTHSHGVVLLRKARGKMCVIYSSF